MNTKDIDWKKIWELIDFQIVLNRMLKEFWFSQKDGGYFTLRDKESGAVIITVLIGSVITEKQERYFSFSTEKGLRCFIENLTSSFMNRNVQKEKFSGAVVGEKYSYSFSGDTEELDEVRSILGCVFHERYIPEEFRANTRKNLEINPMPIIFDLAHFFDDESKTKPDYDILNALKVPQYVDYELIGKGLYNSD